MIFFSFKSMKKKILLMLLISSVLASCTTEEDVDYTPESLAGTWRCSETSSINPNSSYEVEVSKSGGGSNQIRISNFYFLGNSHSVSVNISGASLTIPQQTVSGFSVSGTGTIINQNRINLSYTADDGGGTPDEVSAALTR
jgi:hypothetical protein